MQFEMGVENCHLSAYLTHHGRYHNITNVLVQWIHPLELYKDWVGQFCIVIQFRVFNFGKLGPNIQLGCFRPLQLACPTPTLGAEGVWSLSICKSRTGLMNLRDYSFQCKLELLSASQNTWSYGSRKVVKARKDLFDSFKQTIHWDIFPIPLLQDFTKSLCKLNLISWLPHQIIGYLQLCRFDLPMRSDCT